MRTAPMRTARTPPATRPKPPERALAKPSPKPWYQHRVRLVVACALALLGIACAQPAPPPPAAAPEKPASTTVNPARIDRARDGLPDGYEVTPYTGSPAPFASWGLQESAVADPAQCATLGAPAVDPASARGWSASGAGGIVYAVVAGAAPEATPPSQLFGECAQWSVTAGRATATVTTRPGPAVDAAQTSAMSTAITIVVEGGTETRSHADTFVAYLGDHVCYIVVVTDPGSPHPGLAPEFGSDLLVETVSTLRG
ncbi:putative secreted protein [Mycolicibacterium gilvum]|uniref:Putative secreted protein n=2 Tax=Mycolicibacterium gilvum TaxID=1804 RepID=A0A378SSE4_9MYCO|nr:putative secreted protein [Mycolicibacterium gilvum]